MVQSDRAAQTQEHRTSVCSNQLYLWKAQLALKNKNHRTIEWFVLKGTFKIIYFPCHTLDQVAQGPVQPEMGHPGMGHPQLQGKSLHHESCETFGQDSTEAVESVSYEIFSRP